MKDANKILIVGLAAYFLFMRQSQASDNGGAGGGSNGGAGGGSNGGLPTIGQAGPQIITDAFGQEVAPLCGLPANPYVGTVIDPQTLQQIRICADDPRVNNDPTYQPLNQSPLALV